MIFLRLWKLPTRNIRNEKGIHVVRRPVTRARFNKIGWLIVLSIKDQHINFEGSNRLENPYKSNHEFHIAHYFNYTLKSN